MRCAASSLPDSLFTVSEDVGKSGVHVSIRKMKADQMQFRRALAALLVIFLSTAVMAAQSPLEPVDTSSPRNTYRTFVENMERIRESLEDNAHREEYEYPIERVIQCFNVVDVAPAERGDVGKATALQLNGTRTRFVG